MQIDKELLEEFNKTISDLKLLNEELAQTNTLCQKKLVAIANLVDNGVLIDKDKLIEILESREMGDE